MAAISLSLVRPVWHAANICARIATIVGCGEKCIACWLAIWRYGDNTDKAFVCKEFLLPEAYALFQRTGDLPEEAGKCLVCTRYFTSYVYRLCRLDP